ncbi:MAG: hypothetical protein JO256_07520 [Alphaproteobacteria bacterium]|nr:hypothetical protein [Alphaproteobacteria bacterium]
MKRAILAMAILAAAAGTAAGQMRPVRPATVPDLAPILEKVCLPVAAGQPVAAGVAAGKSLGFAVTATYKQLVTLERERMILNLGPGNCQLTMERAASAAYPHVEHELLGWLPRLGRYWAGPLEGDAAGLYSRKFRAGGHTVNLWEAVDEDERQVNVNIGK